MTEISENKIEESFRAKENFIKENAEKFMNVVAERDNLLGKLKNVKNKYSELLQENKNTETYYETNLVKAANKIQWIVKQMKEKYSQAVSDRDEVLSDLRNLETKYEKLKQEKQSVQQFCAMNIQKVVDLREKLIMKKEPTLQGFGRKTQRRG